MDGHTEAGQRAPEHPLRIRRGGEPIVDQHRHGLAVAKQIDDGIGHRALVLLLQHQQALGDVVRSKEPGGGLVIAAHHHVGALEILQRAHRDVVRVRAGHTDVQHAPGDQLRLRSRAHVRGRLRDLRHICAVRGVAVEERVIIGIALGVAIGIAVEERVTICHVQDPGVVVFAPRARIGLARIFRLRIVIGMPALFVGCGSIGSIVRISRRVALRGRRRRDRRCLGRCGLVV